MDDCPASNPQDDTRPFELRLQIPAVRIGGACFLQKGGANRSEACASVNADSGRPPLPVMCCPKVRHRPQRVSWREDALDLRVSQFDCFTVLQKAVCLKVFVRGNSLPIVAVEPLLPDNHIRSIHSTQTNFCPYDMTQCRCRTVVVMVGMGNQDHPNLTGIKPDRPDAVQQIGQLGQTGGVQQD